MSVQPQFAISSPVPAPPAGDRPVSVRLAATLIVLALALGAAAMWGFLRTRVPPGPPTDPRPAETASAAESERPAGVVEVPRDEWPASKIEVGAAERRPFHQPVAVTGKVALNEDRLAHIHSLVEGRVEKVLVQFGQPVKKGDVLLVVQSQQIGQAKLELHRDRLLLQFSKSKNDWAQAVDRNTQDLIAALKRNVPFDEIDATFRDRPMGDYREKLLSAYTAYRHAATEHDRIESLSKDGIAPQKQLASAKAARDAAAATFQSLLEQIAYDARYAALLASQSLKEAETRVSVDEAALKIVGYSEVDLTDVDPAAEGPALSHYPIRAPFDGTIISKDAVLLERVHPEHLLLSIADLSTVWVTADIYEKHLPQLQTLAGESIGFRSGAWEGERFEARVFYAGEIVDERSRTVTLRAVAENPRRLLKPGLFVDITLPGTGGRPAVQIPPSAVQDYEGKSFVFVHEGDGRFARRDVTLGERNEERVEVRAGLEEGEEIATAGGFALKSRLLADLLSED